MGESWVLQPDQGQRLTLSDGQWIRVKTALNAGETFDLFEFAAPGADLSKGTDAFKSLSPTRVGLALMLWYLLDWSLVDPQGQPMPIRGATIAEKEAMLRALRFERYVEIMTAVTEHDAAVRREKKTPAAVNASPERSPSLVIVAGGTNG